MIIERKLIQKIKNKTFNNYEEKIIDEMECYIDGNSILSVIEDLLLEIEDKEEKISELEDKVWHGSEKEYEPYC